MTREAASAVGDDIYEADHKLPQNPVLKPEQALVVVRERPKNLGGVATHLVESVEEAAAFMSWLSERREVLAVDVETEGFDPWHDKLRLVQFGDAMTGWSIPFERWGGVACEALNKYDGQIVGHNFSFDLKFLRLQANWHVPYHRLHDTMIMAHIIDPTQSVALKNLSVRLIDPRANAGEQLLKEAFHQNKWTWATVPVDYPGYWGYGALDTVLTARLFETLRAHERYPAVYDLEMAARRICTQMEENGAPVDLEYCQATMDKLTEYVDKIKAWGKENFDISIGSTSQLARKLIEMGAVIEKMTAGGAPSCDKFTLQTIASSADASAAAELAKIVLQMRKADKICGSYLSNFINFAVDGIVHPSINTLGARTGRMSIRSPALQTLGKGERTVRDAFIAREGQVLVTCDLDQVEARLLAHFSQDQGLIKAFNDADAAGSEGDFFLNIARNIYRDPNVTMKDKRRKLTKNTIYAKMYGAGPEKIALTAGVPESQIRGVLDALDTAYPGISGFNRSVEDVAVRRLRSEGLAYVNTPLGRRLPADETRIYALTNYAIQGTAAEIFKQGIVRADAAGLGEWMIVPVHDELVMSVPAAEAEEAKKTLEAAMSFTEGYALPLTASAEGPFERWGDSIE